MNFKNLPWLLLLIGMQSIAQFKLVEYNSLSLEAGYGLSFPLTPVSSTNTGGFHSYTHFNGGIRYMFNQDWGIRGGFAFDRFGDNSFSGTQFFRFDSQVYFNLGRKLQIPYKSKEVFNVFLHSGFGVTFVNSKRFDNFEKNGNFIIGISPMFKLSSKATFYLDASLINNFKQHYQYDGSRINDAGDFTTGRHTTFAAGIILYLGEKRDHADWF